MYIKSVMQFILRMPVNCTTTPRKDKSCWSERSEDIEELTITSLLGEMVM